VIVNKFIFLEIKFVFISVLIKKRYFRVGKKISIDKIDFSWRFLGKKYIMTTMLNMNINTYVSTFLKQNAVSLSPMWIEDDFDGMMSKWVEWESANTEGCPWVVNGKVNKKGLEISKVVSFSLKTFIETFGCVLFSEDVWGNLNKEFYERMVNAMWLEDGIQKDIKEKIKQIPSGGGKTPSNKNKSAYLFCCAEFRGSIKESNPESSPQDVTKLLAIRWKEISTSVDGPDKELFEKFTKIASEDKARYELEHPKPVIPKSVSDKKKKSNAKPRGKSAWVIFCNIKRADVKESIGVGATNQQIMLELGKIWASNDYINVKIMAEKKSTEDKERVRELNENTIDDENKAVDNLDNLLGNWDNDVEDENVPVEVVKPTVEKKKKVVEVTKPTVEKKKKVVEVTKPTVEKKKKVVEVTKPTVEKKVVEVTKPTEVIGNLNNLLGNWDDELEEEDVPMVNKVKTILANCDDELDEEVDEELPMVNKVKTILDNWDELDEEVNEELPMVRNNRELFE
jgi:rubrerythrin